MSQALRYSTMHITPAHHCLSKLTDYTVNISKQWTRENITRFYDEYYTSQLKQTLFMLEWQGHKKSNSVEHSTMQYHAITNRLTNLVVLLDFWVACLVARSDPKLYSETPLRAWKVGRLFKMLLAGCCAHREVDQKALAFIKKVSNRLLLHRTLLF